jgi:uncharacterized membrane protein HdeD (DUF308 family)
MSKVASVGAALLFFALIASGLWDLLHGASALTATIALIFVLAGVFNTWGASAGAPKN